MSKERPAAAFFFSGQLLHWALLAVLLAVSAFILDASRLVDGKFWGISTRAWFIASLVLPIVHQLYVWIAWRSELCFRGVTRLLGTAGFTFYRNGFLLLFVPRALVLIALGCADYGSLGLPVAVAEIIAVLFALPAVYTGYSVVRYFGVSRATGIDHFDPAYRELPMVRQGIFRFTGNSMYTFGFMILWAIAFACSSRAALISAGFSHAYIWLHYFCTERPDMQFLYGAGQEAISRDD